MDSASAASWTLPLSRGMMTALVTMLAALGALSTSIYVPSLPDLEQFLATDAAMVQVTMTAFLVGFAVMQLVYGPLSDVKGRRTALLAGLCVFVVGNVICATAASIEQLIVGRIVQALGACVGPVVSRAVVRDAFGIAGAATVMASVAAGISLAPAIGPTIGGLLHTAFGWQANFALLTVMGAGLLFIIWRWLPETNPQKGVHVFNFGVMRRSYHELIRNRTFMTYNIAIALGFGAMFAYITGSPFLFIRSFHLSPAEFGMLTMFNALGFMSGSLIARRKAGAWSNARLANFGTIISVFGGGWLLAQALGGILTVPGVISGVFTFLLGLGILIPAGFAGSIAAAPHLAGAGSGLVGFTQMAMSAVLSYLVAHINRADQVPLMAVIAVAALGSLFATLRLRRAGETASPAKSQA
ncbi:multidrug effflux MFS transporter [Elstera sp.]|uniref:multidrug effflux MFS transporter n=1 Tax=Elstera sp. TaxID=1916664 RepID=UPI0037C0F9DD